MQAAIDEYKQMSAAKGDLHVAAKLIKDGVKTDANYTAGIKSVNKSPKKQQTKDVDQLTEDVNYVNID